MNTYGQKPGQTDWKLFEIEGWPLLVELGPNDDGDGLGIHYKTTVAGYEGLSVSVWVGNANDNPRTAELFTQSFREMTEETAARGLQMLLDNALPLLVGDAA